MSTDYSIICRECKKRLWIGQAYGVFYSGEPAVMKALGEFLWSHINHLLTYCDPLTIDEIWKEGSDWEEIWVDKNQSITNIKKLKI